MAFKFAPPGNNNWLLRLIAGAFWNSDGTARAIPVDTSGGSGVQRTPSLSVVTASGNVAAGAKSVTVSCSSDFTGTILGQAITANEVSDYRWNAPTGDTLGAIVYTITTGELIISTVR